MLRSDLRPKVSFDVAPDVGVIVVEQFHARECKHPFDVIRPAFRGHHFFPFIESRRDSLCGYTQIEFVDDQRTED